MNADRANPDAGGQCHRYYECVFHITSLLHPYPDSSWNGAVPWPDLSPEQRALLALKHRPDRPALQHAVLEGGVARELLDGHAVMLAPAIDDECVGIGDGILITQHPLFTGEESVDLLQQCPGILAPCRLQVLV